MNVLKAGLSYFALVLGAGFVLGPIRLLWLVPRVGTRTAELIELPIMLVIIVASARWLVRRLVVPPRPAGTLGMGFLALALLVAVELFLIGPLQGYSASDYFSARDPVSGSAYFASLVLFALIPFLLTRNRNR